MKTQLVFFALLSFNAIMPMAYLEEEEVEKKEIVVVKSESNSSKTHIEEEDEKMMFDKFAEKRAW